jgi:hypothetical protein
LLLCAKAAVEPNRSVKQKVSETKILKPDIIHQSRNVPRVRAEQRRTSPTAVLAEVSCM